MKQKSKVLKFFTNIYVKNIFLMIVVLFVIILLTLFSLNLYTHHNEYSVVPSLKGLQIGEASKLLTSQGLTYEVVDSIYSPDGVAGAIIDQVPKENSKVKGGRSVYLTVQSKTVQQVAIPALQDYSQRQAEAQLKALGFNKIAIEEVSSPYKELVISVSYNGRELKAGEKIPKGSPLKLVVGAGDSSLDGDSINTTVTTNPDVDNSFFE